MVNLPKAKNSHHTKQIVNLKYILGEFTKPNMSRVSLEILHCDENITAADGSVSKCHKMYSPLSFLT